MSYSTKILQSKEDAHNRHVATKIIDSLKKLRLNPNEHSPRRWIWELLQNAKDVAHEKSTVSIEINYQQNGEEGMLEFRHSGKPFSVRNLTFLIEQVSAKDRDLVEEETNKTTGKFGTGFLTTHLLSEKVEVESIVQEDDEPYKKFKMLLDRSGKTIDEIIESVAISHGSIAKLDSEKSYEDYSSLDYNTTFRYKLDKKGIAVAQKGLEDLHNSLLYTLVFVAEIKTVSILHEDVQYELNSEVVDIDDFIKIHTITKTTPLEIIETRVAVLTQNNISIAVEVEYNDERIDFKKFDSMTPRLFCELPLIGTDEFPFPVIINSAKFNPTEPRDGVFLSDADDEEVYENKSIVLNAIELYYKLLNHASKDYWGNIHVLATVPKLREMEGFSKEWFEHKILTPLQNKLLITPIVDTENDERIAILNDNGDANVMFPSSTKKELREKIWDLANLSIPCMLPRKVDIDIWYGIKWTGCSQLTLQVIANEIELKENLSNLGDTLVNSTNPIKWLNTYFEIINLDEEFLNKVIQDEFIIIPNQNGDFRKKSDLQQDEGIDDELMNTLSIIGVDCRDYLLHREIDKGKISYIIKKQEDIIDEINKILKEDKTEGIIEASNYLISLYSDDPNFPEKREVIYQFCENVYPNSFSIKRKINKWSEDIWQEVDKKQLKRITQTISDTKNVYKLGELINLEDTQTLKWLKDFVTFLTEHQFDNLINLRQAPILPNQNGSFCTKDDLFLDNKIDNELKEISAELGTDFRDELLDNNISVDLPDNRIYNSADVASEINQLVHSISKESVITDKIKKAYNKLLVWFNINEEKAEKLFGDLYINKHRLYDDDEIAANIQRSEEVSKLLSEFKIEDLSSLRELLKKNKSPGISNEPEEITKNAVVDLGVTSMEEWEVAMQNSEIASQFFHTSKPTKEMLDYALELITRTKKNVFAYLNSLPSYNCDDWEELSPTVIGGIKKEGHSINVVVRPSDSGIVIIFYNSEKDILDFERSELWIENGKDDPVQLTLGKILKKTGINRIPV